MVNMLEILNNIMSKYNNVELSWSSAKSQLELLDKVESHKEKLSECPLEFGKNTTLPNGRFYTDIRSAHIEGFLIPGKEKKMYVFLHGARGGENLDDLEKPPRFLRNTYNNYFDGSILCLEDPMFYSFKRCKLGWYYGTDTEDYRDYCARVIKRIAMLLSIKVENIVLFGSSGGGTAAIGIANYLRGSTVVALNPQLELDSYFRTPEIEEVTGLKIRDHEDKFLRNNNAKLILNNGETKFIILVNVLSDHDYKNDLAYICRSFNLKPRYGISKKNNLYIWTYMAKGTPYEHSSFETPAIFLTIRTVCECLQGEVSVNYLQGFCLLVNKFWKEIYDIKNEMYIEQKSRKIDKELLAILNERQEYAKRVLFNINDKNLILKSKDFSELFPGSGEWLLENCENGLKIAKVVVKNNSWYELRLKISSECKKIAGDFVLSLDVKGNPEYVYVSIGAHNSQNGRRYSEISNIKLNNRKFSKIVEIFENGWKRYSVHIPIEELKKLDDDKCDMYSAQIKVLNSRYMGKEFQEFYFKKPKLETGFVATEWSEAPEDSI